MFEPSKFRVGQLVYFNPGGPFGSREIYEITRVLPSEGDDPSYRVKCTGERYERVARASQLESGDRQIGEAGAIGRMNQL